jgi:hypothetical protein
LKLEKLGPVRTCVIAAAKSGVKRRRKTLDKGTEARRVARKSGIKPGATRVIEDKRKRPAKHKKDWLLDE